MQVSEFVTAKREMEDAICTAVTAAVAKFRAATQHTPSRINVHMIDRTRVGDARAQHMVGQVKADVEID